MTTLDRSSTVDGRIVIDLDAGVDRRRRAIVTASAMLMLLVAVVIAGTLLADVAEKPNIEIRNAAPSFSHPFGTDWLGRDMLARTMAGLRLSLFIGVLASVISTVIALTLASAAGAFGGRVDAAVSGLVDLFLALPHLVLLILIAVAVGGGLAGVTVAVAFTHWPSLTRVLRAEARRVASSDYVALSRKLGRSRLQIGREHLLGHLVPQASVGLVLLFPHAILHEAALSFLGLGLPPHQPAIGILLADSMRYLSAGIWWPALLPGLSLLIVVKSVDVFGEQLRSLTDPRSVHE
jgi:peptide/nickel transport system permease protein